MKRLTDMAVSAVIGAAVITGFGTSSNVEAQNLPEYSGTGLVELKNYVNSVNGILGAGLIGHQSFIGLLEGDPGMSDSNSLYIKVKANNEVQNILCSNSFNLKGKASRISFDIADVRLEEMPLGYHAIFVIRDLEYRMHFKGNSFPVFPISECPETLDAVSTLDELVLSIPIYLHQDKFFHLPNLMDSAGVNGVSVVDWDGLAYMDYVGAMHPKEQYKESIVNTALGYIKPKFGLTDLDSQGTFIKHLGQMIRAMAEKSQVFGLNGGASAGVAQSKSSNYFYKDEYGESIEIFGSGLKENGRFTVEPTFGNQHEFNANISITNENNVKHCSGEEILSPGEGNIVNNAPGWAYDVRHQNHLRLFESAVQRAKTCTGHENESLKLPYNSDFEWMAGETSISAREMRVNYETNGQPTIEYVLGSDQNELTLSAVVKGKVKLRTKIEDEDEVVQPAIDVAARVEMVMELLHRDMRALEVWVDETSFKLDDVILTFAPGADQHQEIKDAATAIFEEALHGRFKQKLLRPIQQYRLFQRNKVDYAMGGFFCETWEEIEEGVFEKSHRTVTCDPYATTKPNEPAPEPLFIADFGEYALDIIKIRLFGNDRKGEIEVTYNLEAQASDKAKIPTISKSYPVEDPKNPELDNKRILALKAVANNGSGQPQKVHWRSLLTPFQFQPVSSTVYIVPTEEEREVVEILFGEDKTTIVLEEGDSMRLAALQMSADLGDYQPGRCNPGAYVSNSDGEIVLVSNSETPSTWQRQFRVRERRRFKSVDRFYETCPIEAQVPTEFDH